jgi:hypothetical protein
MVPAVRTGASLTAATVTEAVVSPMLKALLPPVVGMPTNVPALPTLRSHARKLMVLLPL